MCVCVYTGFAFLCGVGGYLIKVDGQGRGFGLAFTK